MVTISNNASILVLEFRVTVKLFDSLSYPSHPTNLYPSSAVAVIVTSVPSSYVPPWVETVPPSPAVTVIVYFVGVVGSGVWTKFGGGVVGSSPGFMFEAAYGMRIAGIMDVRLGVRSTEVMDGTTTLGKKIGRTGWMDGQVVLGINL